VIRTRTTGDECVAFTEVLSLSEHRAGVLGGSRPSSGDGPYYVCHRPALWWIGWEEELFDYWGHMIGDFTD